MSEQRNKQPDLIGHPSWDGIGTDEGLAHWVEKTPDFDEIFNESTPDFQTEDRLLQNLERYQMAEYMEKIDWAHKSSEE